jgi:hypothetical protein
MKGVFYWNSFIRVIILTTREKVLIGDKITGTFEHFRLPIVYNTGCYSI